MHLILARAVTRRQGTSRTIPLVLASLPAQVTTGEQPDDQVTSHPANERLTISTRARSGAAGGTPLRPDGQSGRPYFYALLRAGRPSASAAASALALPVA